MPAAHHPLHVALAVLLPALAPIAAATPLVAQDSTAAALDEWRVGALLGVPGEGQEVFFPAFTVGMHLLHLPPGRMAFDASVGVAPMVLAEGWLFLGARSGISFPIRSDSRLILPGGGVSMLGYLSGSGAGRTFGGHVGGAVVSAGGLRTGVTFHWLSGESLPVWLFEVGFLPARADRAGGSREVPGLR